MRSCISLYDLFSFIKFTLKEPFPLERSVDEMKKNRGFFWSYEIISYFCTAIRDEMSRLAQKEVWVSG